MTMIDFFSASLGNLMFGRIYEMISKRKTTETTIRYVPAVAAATVGFIYRSDILW